LKEVVTVSKSDPCRGRTPFESLGAAWGKRLQQSPLRSSLRWIYRRLLQLQTLGRGFECRLPEGESLRVLPEYRFVTWNLQEYRAFRPVVKRGCVALDVGANIGAYSLLLGLWTGPTGKVYAFEPAPDAFSGLQRHVRLNRLEKVVVPVQAAVSDSVGEASFQFDGIHGTNRLARAGESSGRAVRVPATTIDEFCARERVRPDFIKVDVEGFEAAVLRGARNTILANDGLSIFVEMHPRTWPTVGVSVEEVQREIESAGRTAEALAPGEPLWTVEGVSLRLVAKGR
jgi:FkbM family methyltransferase